MIRELLSSGTLGHYAQAALLLFVLSFALVLIWAVFGPKEQMQHMANLPCEDDAPVATPGPQETSGQGAERS